MIFHFKYEQENKICTGIFLLNRLWVKSLCIFHVLAHIYSSVTMFTLIGADFSGKSISQLFSKRWTRWTYGANIIAVNFLLTGNSFLLTGTRKQFFIWIHEHFFVHSFCALCFCKTNRFFFFRNVGFIWINLKYITKRIIPTLKVRVLILYTMFLKNKKIFFSLEMLDS